MKSLAAKMVAVMRDVPTMEKNGYNAQQKYQFVSVEDIKSIIRPLLTRHGIALFSSMVDVNHTVRLTPKQNGGESAVMTVFAKMRFVLVDMETGESMEHLWVGEANDYGDKATNKSATAALKYWLINTFLLSTVESEADDEYIPTPAPQPAQLATPQEPLATPSMVDKVESLAAAYYRSEWSEEFKKGLVYKTTKKRTADITLLTQAEAQRMIDYFANAIETEPQPA